MKHRKLEIIALASLFGYVAIVVAGQVLHWIPGLGCHCHSVATESDSVRTYHQEDATDQGTSYFAASNQVAGELDFDCPICDWFSESQRPASRYQYSSESLCRRRALAPFAPRFTSLTNKRCLPRGPPATFAVCMFKGLF